MTLRRKRASCIANYRENSVASGVSLSMKFHGTATLSSFRERETEREREGGGRLRLRASFNIPAPRRWRIALGSREQEMRTAKRENHRRDIIPLRGLLSLGTFTPFRAPISAEACSRRVLSRAIDHKRVELNECDCMHYRPPPSVIALCLAPDIDNYRLTQA